MVHYFSRDIGYYDGYSYLCQYINHNHSHPTLYAADLLSSIDDRCTRSSLSSSRYGIFQCICTHFLVAVRLFDRHLSLYFACGLLLPQVSFPPNSSYCRRYRLGAFLDSVHVGDSILGDGYQ